MSVHYFDYNEDRELLADCYERQGEEGIKAYWTKNNQKSINGFESKIVELNFGES